MEFTRVVEKIGWMAANGHLSDSEVEKIAAKGSAARERLDTDAERVAAGGNGEHGADRLAVALADAMRDNTNAAAR